MTDRPLELFHAPTNAFENKKVLNAEELNILSDLEEKIPKEDNNEISLSSYSEIEESNDSSDEESTILSDDEIFAEEH